MSSATSVNEIHVPRNIVPAGALGAAISDDEMFASVEPSHNQRSIVMIDSRALDRECFARSIAAHRAGMTVLPVGSLDEWTAKSREGNPPSAVLFNIGGHKVTEAGVSDEIRKLVSSFGSVPVVILADTDDLAQILNALEFGVKGYIPSSVGIDVCIEAIDLALAGGIFVPASSVMAMRQMLASGMEAPKPMAGLFTARQAEVVEALRRGKANKIIAYELNLRESTVKVHIRNIMKKLKATNRTEVAYKINDLFPITSYSQRGFS